MLNVCIIGTGYVGLVTGACLSELGHSVVCVDTDEAKIARLRKRRDPDLRAGPRTSWSPPMSGAELLRFTADVGEAVAHGADVLFIAVGTPTDENGGGANLDYVYAAVEQAAQALAARPRRRTSSPSSSRSRPCRSARAGRSPTSSASICRATASPSPPIRSSCAKATPSRTSWSRTGSSSARNSERARKLLEDLYMPLTRKGRPLVVTSTVETAELIKYAANAFLATKVTFINELARLCEAAGADIQELALGVGLDNRIGTEFLRRRPGLRRLLLPEGSARAGQDRQRFRLAGRRSWRR